MGIFSRAGECEKDGFFCLEFKTPFLPPFVQSVEVGLEDLLGLVRVFGRRVNCDVVCIRLSLDSSRGGA